MRVCVGGPARLIEPGRGIAAATLVLDRTCGPVLARVLCRAVRGRANNGGVLAS